MRRGNEIANTPHLT